MHPRIAELFDYLDAEYAGLVSAFESVPAERRAARPTPDRWSPAEIVHHLTIVERRLVHRLRQLVEEARALEPETETSSLFPMVLATKVENRDRRLSTTEAGEPKDTDPSRVLADFADVRNEFKGVVASGDGLRLGEVKAPHPVLGHFSAYEWIAFAAAHSKRHAEQIREMMT